MVAKMRKTTRAMLVLLFAITLFSQISTEDSTVGQDSKQSSCLVECSLVECKRASSTDIAISVIGTLFSGFVSISPMMRVTKKFDRQDNAVKKYRWFMTFLALLTLDNIAWVGYSLRDCRYCEATIFMIINSVFGAAVSCLWTLIGLLRDQEYIADKEDKVTLVICYAFVVAAFGYKSYCVNSGYYVLAGALTAHLCRVMGTDYTRFSRPQLLVSFVGSFGVGGLLWIRHPDLDVAQPFWLEFVGWSVFGGFCYIFVLRQHSDAGHKMQ